MAIIIIDGVDAQRTWSRTLVWENGKSPTRFQSKLKLLWLIRHTWRKFKKIDKKEIISMYATNKIIIIYYFCITQTLCTFLCNIRISN